MRVSIRRDLKFSVGTNTSCLRVRDVSTIREYS